MIRFIALALFCFLYMVLSIILWPVLFFLEKKKPLAADALSMFVIQFGFKICLKISGVRLNVIGLENIPPDKAVLFVANHRSIFDVVTTYTTLKNTTGYISKIEIRKVPVFSTWMKKIHCLFLDRKDLKKGLKTILESIEKVKNGISQWIFPEGTRGRDDNYDMLPFKEGSLKIAAKSGCPVVPVAIVNTGEIFEKQIPRIKPQVVTIKYGAPFLIEDLSGNNKKFPAAYTKDLIKNMLDEIISQRK